MPVLILPYPCALGAILPLFTEKNRPGHYLASGEVAPQTGLELYRAHDSVHPVFRVCGSLTLPCADSLAAPCALLEALQPVREAPAEEFEAKKPGYAVAVITLSDKGAMGMREDTAGPLCLELLRQAIPVGYASRFIIPDEAPRLRSLLADLALAQSYDLICTSGGTGLAPRDITPQATASLLDFTLPGFMQAMMGASLAKTPRAAISRALAGVMGQCLVINLPGSRKAAQENLEPLLPALEHALSKLKGNPDDCGA